MTIGGIGEASSCGAVATQRAGASQRAKTRPEGFEPPTGGLEIRCSIHLSYGRTQGDAWLRARSRIFAILRRLRAPTSDDSSFISLCVVAPLHTLLSPNCWRMNPREVRPD